MASSATRYEIVTRSLTRAGRGVELRGIAEEMLNDLLRKIAGDYKFPELRKQGDVVTLSAGSQTAALPTDFGAGMDSMLFGDERKLILEKMPDEFYQNGGVQPTVNGATGRPNFYIVDKEAGLFRFNTISDKAYTFIPVYFKMPADIPTPDQDGDDMYPWFSDNETLIQGLILSIYQYTSDVREQVQETKFNNYMGRYQQGSVPPGGGVSRILPARSRFRKLRI
jgi:hypothetical protein